MRVVLDTGIFVSALITKDTPPDILYNGWRDRQFDLVTSLAQMDELERVLTYKKLQRYISRNEAMLILNTLGACAEVLEAIPQVNLSPDPDDNKIIATAMAGTVDYLVTGDKKDLLSLENVEGVSIVTARKAVGILNLID